MKCDEARMRMVDELTGSADAELAEHLSGCDTCREEARSVQRTWARMEALTVPEPSPRMVGRFHDALEAYKLGLEEAPKSRLFNWWPRNPAWGMAAAFACLVAGFFTGPIVMSNRGGASSSSEIAELRKEMTGMRQLVTLSLLQQQSAAERLRGVNWSYRAESDDVEVLSALLRTVSQDSNVDVQLAAVDALRNFGSSAVARKGLIQSLGKQASPLVQIAVIDLLVDLRDYSARPALKRLIENDGTHEIVRKRAESALQTLVQ